MQTKIDSHKETALKMFVGFFTAWAMWQYMIVPLAIHFAWNFQSLLLYQVFVIQMMMRARSYVETYSIRRYFATKESRKGSTDIC